jgi:hypothetical protein
MLQRVPRHFASRSWPALPQSQGAKNPAQYAGNGRFRPPGPDAQTYERLAGNPQVSQPPDSFLHRCRIRVALAKALQESLLESRHFKAITFAASDIHNDLMISVLHDRLKIASKKMPEINAVKRGT